MTLKRPTEVLYRLFTIPSMWYKNIYLEMVPSLGFCACMHILIHFLVLNTVMFPRKHSLGLIQRQQKGSGILWQQLLFFYERCQKKKQSKFNDPFTLTVLEHNMGTLVCHVNLGLDMVQFLRPRGRSDGAYF